MAMVSVNIAKIPNSRNGFWTVHIIFNVFHKNDEITLFLLTSP